MQKSVDILKKVEGCIVELINIFQLNPFEYFYEEDIRAKLYTELKSKIKINFNFPTLGYINVIGKGTIESSIIKAEYPAHKRFDIAILDYKNCNLNSDFYNQPVSIAIELKLGSHKIHMDRTSGLKSDIIKLKEYISAPPRVFTGIAIYFCQTNISETDVNDWYQDILNAFELIEINKLNLVSEKIYALIVPSEPLGKIYLSNILF